MNVTKLGNDEACNYESTEETSWGCIHTGIATVWNPQNAEYYHYNNQETVDITNAYDGTIHLDVKHHFSDYEKYYDGDHSIRGILSIFVNNQLMGEYAHKQNKNTDTHLGTVTNPDYVGNYLVTVECDNQCNCQVNKANY